MYSRCNFRYARKVGFLSMEEIRSALFGMKNLSLHLPFFKNQWHNIKQTLFDFGSRMFFFTNVSRCIAEPIWI